MQGFSQRLGRIMAVCLLLTTFLAGAGSVRTAAAADALCFNVPGVTECVAPEFRAFWEGNGGLPVFGYPKTAAKMEQTPEGMFLTQYFERQRLEYHPNNNEPYKIQLGRINDEVLGREGRNWRDFPKGSNQAGCAYFAETMHSACGTFLAYWKSQGLDMGDPGVSMREALALWGMPLSEPMMEMNVDGDNVLTQHFERARLEVHEGQGKTGEMVLGTRLGVMLVPMNLRIVAVNDFHGQISKGRRFNNKDVGGAAILATYIKNSRAGAPYSLLVNGGDNVGASPPASALLQDQPAIDFFNRLGMDVGTIGNHEFDEGLEEMLRLYNGGKHPKVGDWKGANFPTTVANVVYKSNNKPIFPPYYIANVDGARVGFIGVVLKDTPTIVIESATKDVLFLDEVESVNKYVKELQGKGVKTIIVLAHQGGSQDAATGKVTGPIVSMTEGFDDEVDVVITGHTHTLVNATIDGKLVVQALSYSQAFDEVDLVIDRAKRDVVSKKGNVVVTYAEGVTPDAEIDKMVKDYEAQTAAKVNEVIGTASKRLSGDQNPAGESDLGNLIADAQRAQMGTQFAFMNPGGIRAPIEAGEVTWGELFTVQPFSNDVVKMTLTGDQIYTLLNQQWQTNPDGTRRTRFLQISGLSYTWNDSLEWGNKVVEVRGADGKALDKAAEYSLTVNSFLSTGGDSFTILRSGKNKVVGPDDLTALINYIKSLPQPFTANIEGRIVKQ